MTGIFCRSIGGIGGIGGIPQINQMKGDTQMAKAVPTHFARHGEPFDSIVLDTLKASRYTVSDLTFSTKRHCVIINTITALQAYRPTNPRFGIQYQPNFYLSIGHEC